LGSGPANHASKIKTFQSGLAENVGKIAFFDVGPARESRGPMVDLQKMQVNLRFWEVDL